MYTKLFVVTFLYFSSITLGLGQTKSALKHLTKNDFAKAEAAIRKALSKNPNDAGDMYLYSRYYATPANPAFHLDSANHYALAATTAYPQLPPKRKQKLGKLAIDSLTIFSHKEKIDSLAFEAAVAQHTEEAYQHFIDLYPTASQVSNAVAARNELAFAEARRINTYDSFRAFFSKYPDAEQAKQAQEVYEILLFETQTKEGTLQAYQSFVKSYPNNAYVKEAERRIYEITTAAHTPEAYSRFTENYPENTFVKRAWQWLTVLAPERNKPEEFARKYAGNPDKQTLELLKLNRLQYLPYLDSGKYGFMDELGQNRLTPQYDSIPEDYLCGDVPEDHLVAYKAGKAGAVDKAGRSIADFKYKELDAFAPGVLKAVTDSGVVLIHHAGTPLLHKAFEDVEPVGKSFIKVISKGKAGLYTYQGRELLPPMYDEITEEEGYVLVLQNGKYAVTNFEQLHPVLENKPVSLDFIYNEITAPRADYLVVRVGEGRGVVGKNFRLVIPATAKSIQPTTHGWILKKGEQFYLHQLNGKPLTETGFDKLIYNENYIGAKSGNKWGIYTADGELFKNFEYDSVQFLAENILLLFINNNMFVAFGKNEVVDFSRFNRLEVLTNLYTKAKSEKPVYFVSATDAAGKKTLYSASGKALLPGKYDKISLLLGNLLLLEQNKLSGLADSTGKIILPLQYNGAGTFGRKQVSILKGGKFGLYNPQTKKLIAPQYEANLGLYNDQQRYYTALKKNKYGLIDEDNKILVPFAYDEIQYWQPQMALVRDGDSWYFYDLAKKQQQSSRFDAAKAISTSDDEIILKVSRALKNGIISSKHGEILPLVYDEITQIGPVETPLYFASIYNEQERTYNVDYFDSTGKQIRSQLLSEDMYDKIACD